MLSNVGSWFVVAGLVACAGRINGAAANRAARKSPATTARLRLTIGPGLPLVENGSGRTSQTATEMSIDSFRYCASSVSLLRVFLGRRGRHLCAAPVVAIDH